MRNRTYVLIAATTAIATAVSAINKFVEPRFGLWDEALIAAIVVSASIVMSAFNSKYQFSTIRSSIVYKFITMSLALIFGWSATVNLSYSIQIFAMPLRDELFLAADHLFGFDYVLFMRWISDYPGISVYLTAIYSLFPPLIIMLTLVDVVLPGDRRLGEDFFTSALIAFLLAFAICALLPAAGAASLLDPHTAAFATGATPLDRLYALRSGDVHQFNRGAAGGLVSFPSMHVAIAVLALHATRNLKLLFWCVLPISLGFCVTALTNGGHYLVDCFAGAAVAGVAIKLNRAFKEFRVPNFYFRAIYGKDTTGDLGRSA